MQKMINKNPLERKKVEELLNDQWLTGKGQHLMVLFKQKEKKVMLS
jgi:hypothetical protein